MHSADHVQIIFVGPLENIVAQFGDLDTLRCFVCMLVNQWLQPCGRSPLEPGFHLVEVLGGGKSLAYQLFQIGWYNIA
jgi:hypothetical protein